MNLDKKFSAPNISEHIFLSYLVNTDYANTHFKLFEPASAGLKITKISLVPGIFWIRSEYNSKAFSQMMVFKKNCFLIVTD